MGVGVKERLTDSVMDAVGRAGIRIYAHRGETVARLLLPEGRRDPYPIYEQLRAAGGMVKTRRMGAWMATDYESVNLVLRHPEFGSDPRKTNGYRETPGPSIRDWEMILGMDDPDHARIRRLLSRAFSPRAVASWRPLVEQVADELLDGVEGRDFDLVGEFAVPLTVRVICRLMGVPSLEWRQFKTWGENATRSMGLNNGRADVRVAAAALDDVANYFRHLVEERRATPGEDLLSVMIAAEEDGESLSDRELIANCVLLLIAGFETTVNLIGNGMAALLAHPSQWQRLIGDPQLAVNAAEEVLRYDSPVQFTGRTASTDVDLDAGRIAQGEQVLVLLASANNDPTVFRDPRRFDITRENARSQVSFSAGAHYCLGASLARLEGEVALGALATRRPGLRLGPGAVRRPGDLMRGYRSLPLSA
jgi:cytochrome P450